MQKVGAISGQAFTAVAARASAPSAAIPPTSASPTTHSLRFLVAILPFEKGDLHHATSDPRPRQSEEAALVADDSRAHKATRQVRECDRRSRKGDKESLCGNGASRLDLRPYWDAKRTRPIVRPTSELAGGAHKRYKELLLRWRFGCAMMSVTQSGYSTLIAVSLAFGVEGTANAARRRPGARCRRGFCEPYHDARARRRQVNTNARQRRSVRVRLEQLTSAVSEHPSARRTDASDRVRINDRAHRPSQAWRPRGACASSDARSPAWQPTSACAHSLT